MKRILTSGLVAVAVLATAGSAFAGSSYDNKRIIDQREANQEQRIRSGIRDGSLTRREARALENEQRHIRELERRALADGRIDSREAAEIRRAQDNASRHIYNERHDSERRHRRWWW